MTSEARLLGMPARWARRLLVVSLAINFLVVGVIVGVGAGHKGSQRIGTTVHLRTEIVRLIADEGRKAEAEAVLKDGVAAWRSSRSLRNDRWDAMAEQIEAAPFDAAALIASFDHGLDAREEARRTSRVALAEAIGMMTDAERAALADSLREFRERRAHERRGR